ncbi:MAG TPA: fructosamine kinase family protein [Miltoncostaeaceae bacterium]|nr:fructosamine kinase family protein [Miltoncostaeaceae bacterium]
MIPAAAHRAAAALHTTPTAHRPVGGGSINRAARVACADGRIVFLKHHPAPPRGMFAAEAHGLRRLAAANAMRVPAVLAAGDDRLVLEWLAPGPAAPDHDERLGRDLAALHRAGAPAFGDDRPGFIATLPLDNRPAPDWASFYLKRRIAPLARAAIDTGALPARCARQLDGLAAHIGDLIGPPEPPALLHGDLWSGNLISDRAGAPVVIDPSVHGGHREIDLAMMRLFGGFSPRVFAAYAEVFPLAPGAGERVSLYQLYPLLVHTVLFGGGYGERAARILARHA